ncbi:hypothetical protein pb186bvf_005280 [Paramecium bursaria]
MIVRFIYNKKKLQLEGEEAIPHIELWRIIQPIARAKFLIVTQKINLIIARKGTGYFNV